MQPQIILEIDFAGRRLRSNLQAPDLAFLEVEEVLFLDWWVVMVRLEHRWHDFVVELLVDIVERKSLGQRQELRNDGHTGI